MFYGSFLVVFASRTLFVPACEVTGFDQGLVVWVLSKQLVLFKTNQTLFICLHFSLVNFNCLNYQDKSPVALSDETWGSILFLFCHTWLCVNVWHFGVKCVASICAAFVLAHGPIDAH